MAGASTVPSLELHDGVSIPQVGFGVFEVPPEETRVAVESALAAGYRHIDTAAIYANEVGVGEALAAAGLAREEVFITTKLWNAEQGYETTLEACERSLQALGTDHLDLYLIHWPVPTQDRFLDTWRAFERIKEEGKSRSIGVSNFRIEDLERLEREAEQLPTVNQVELHPYLQQPELRAWHAEHDVATESWSPLARGGAELLGDEALGAIAARLGKSTAQVILRWHVQIGAIVIPRSVRPERVKENFELFDFELSEEDMARIAGLDRGERIGPDPATFVAP